MPESSRGATRSGAAAAPALSFDRVASEYERTRYLPPEVARAAAALICRDLPPGSFFLDAGVGTGRYGRALAARHARTVGVDVSRDMMARLKHAAAVPRLVRADLRALPFGDGVFAGALAAHVFHLIADWRAALGEVWRVLTPEQGVLWVAREEEDDLPVRSFYLRRAAERGVLPQNPGARTAQVLDALRGAGAQVRIIAAPDPDSLCWERTWSAQEMLDLLDGRAYSLLWSIPEDVHRRLLAETHAWAVGNFGSLHVRARALSRLTLYAARKPAGP